ncbi:hypothetical protein [Microlunatus sp. GCM10028923]|uniref:hypothetical protein n=1 Tax=Microlunatus sp. GCM10028923 TaxID=3273400 RepID=UPI0036169397
MVSAKELVRGLVAVLATVLVIVGLTGFGTSVTDPDAVLRSSLALLGGLLTLAWLIRRERTHRTPAPRRIPASHR